MPEISFARVFAGVRADRTGPAHLPGHSERGASTSPLILNLTEGARSAGLASWNVLGLSPVVVVVVVVVLVPRPYPTDGLRGACWAERSQAAESPAPSGAVLGTESSGKGIGASGGTFGGAKKAEDLEGLGVGTGDYDIIAILGPAFARFETRDVNALSAAYLASSINALSSACAAAGTANEWSGVADLDSFATYHNLTTTTKWQCLLPPDFYSA